MQVVKKSNLGLIKSIFNSNTDNEQYYEIINNVFNGKVDCLEFAKPTIQTNAGYILWKAKTPGPYSKYSELKDEKQKLYLNNMVQKALNDIKGKLSNLNQDEDFLSKIIEIPSEDSIFFTQNNNSINIILTEWGFTKDEFVESQGILKKIFPNGLQSFILKFKSKNGEFLEGINCSINTNNDNYEGVSDSRGFISLNDLQKNQELKIKSVDNNFSDSSIIIGDNNEHTIIVERTFELTFKVIDSNKIPVENASFIFASEILGKKTFVTNYNGQFGLKHIENNSVFTILDKDENALLSKKIPNQDSEYTIVYNKLKELNEENIELITPALEEEEFIAQVNKDVTIELLNWRKKPIVNQSLSFYGSKEGKLNFVTDSNGQFHPNKLLENKEYSIFMKYKKADWKKDFLHSKQNKEYTFIVKNKKILWWWLPVFILFFLLISLIPTDLTHHYTVLDKNTDLPIEGAYLSSTIPSVYQTNALNNKTDKDGKLDIAYGKLALYKQIFYKPSTSISVSKNAYESLVSEVSLAYFRTTKSNIFLDPYQRDTLAVIEPQEPATPCGGGENEDDTGNQTKRFDLGKENSTFLFEYYNDNQMDIISVLCDDGQLLFICDWATGTESFINSKKIKSPCRYITVNVIGTSNWGIRVNCP